MAPARIRYPSLTRLLWLTLVGLGLATLLARLGRFSWFFELFAHFPLQYALGLAVAAAGALLLRQWRPALLAVVLLVPNLAALSYYFPARSDTESGGDLRVVSFNVLTSNSNYGAALEYLAASGADFILVMETDERWLDALSPLEADYPHVLRAPRGDNFGMAFYSRHPIRSHVFRPVEGSRVPCLSAVVALGDREIRVIGGHPVPPVGGVRAAARNEYLDALGELAAGSTRPTVLLGDLNVTAWSPFFREFLRTSGLRDSGRKRGFQASWQRERLPLAIPIDHILHSADLACTGREIGPDLGSDHRPVVAEFRFL